jgi:hypothetical protein
MFGLLPYCLSSRQRWLMEATPKTLRVLQRGKIFCPSWFTKVSVGGFKSEPVNIQSE